MGTVVRVPECPWYVWDGLRIAQERSSINGAPNRWHYEEGYLSLTLDQDEYYSGSYYKKDHLGSIRAVYTLESGSFSGTCTGVPIELTVHSTALP